MNGWMDHMWDFWGMGWGMCFWLLLFLGLGYCARAETHVEENQDMEQFSGNKEITEPQTEQSDIIAKIRAPSLVRIYILKYLS